MKIVKYALLWLALTGLAMAGATLDGIEGDEGMLLDMIYGSLASYTTFGVWVLKEGS